MIMKLRSHEIGNFMKTITIIFFLIINNITYSNTDIFVHDIYFNGLERVSPDTILSNLPLKVGSLINENNIANSIRMLFSTGYFENIRIISDDLGVITIQFKERPIIDNISICGNKTVKEDIIKRILNLKCVTSGQPLNNSAIFSVEHDLQDMYYSLGKFDAIVKIDIVSFHRNCVNLKVTITEGKSAKIKKIKIIGNHVFSNKQLLWQFQLHDKTQWWNILYNKQYEMQKLLHDLEALRNFYLNHGYAKFSIDSTQVNLTSDKKNIYFYLYITEGEQYSFSSVTFHGNILTVFPNIKSYINICSGDLYSIDAIKKIECNIQYILGQYGYVQPSISIESDIDEKNKIVKLHVYVDIGRRYYVREVCVEGNNFTKDLVIRRKINQMEKTQINYAKVLRDQERLKNLGYFKNVATHIKYLSNTSNQVDVIYQVEECNTGNLNLSIGAGTESGINIQFGMYQGNILGTGNSISVTSTKNHYQNYSEMSFTQSYCNIDKMSMEWKIFYNNMHTNYANLSDYQLKNYGVNYDCLYSFIEHNKFIIGLNYISNYLSKITPQVAIWRYLHSMHIYPKLLIDKFFDNNINFYTHDFMLKSGWMFNNLNHPYFPTAGLYINILGKITLPGSNNQYYKITFNGDHYLSLDKSSYWIFMTSIYAGYAGSIHNKENPFYDNFYAGGINTIRGFRLNSVGPKAAYYYCNKRDKSYTTCSVKNSQDSIGGNAISLLKAELIIPIVYFNEQFLDTTRISVFIDTGTVWDTFWKDTEMTRAAGIPNYSLANNIRVSSGVSLKWISPIGPVIFSYSKLIKKYLGDVEEPFQFSIGRTW